MFINFHEIYLSFRVNAKLRKIEVKTRKRNNKYSLSSNLNLRKIRGISNTINCTFEWGGKSGRRKSRKNLLKKLKKSELKLTNYTYSRGSRRSFWKESFDWRNQ